MRAVLGGSFDPPHVGHLFMAQEAARHLPVEEVLWMPSRKPPHKAGPRVQSDHRLAMVEMSCQLAPRSAVDRTELDREGESYTLDTLKTLEKLGRGPVCWLLGADMFRSFPLWHEPREILELAALAVFPRGEDNLHEGLDRLPQWLNARVRPWRGEGRIHAGEVVFLDAAPPAVSSTQIRRMVREGQDISSLVVPAVFDYIQETGTYRS